jgi:transcriptional regulator with XRE-family HTH domain
MSLSWVSREARLKIVETLLSSRSIKQLASEIGVSPTAVRKYANGRASPDDEVLARLLSVVAPYEKEKVYDILLGDLINSIRSLLELVDDPKYRDIVRERIIESVRG